MKNKILGIILLFTCFVSSSIAAEPEVRYREMTAIIDQIHGERKDHLVFEKGTRYVEPFTFIAPQELAYVVTVEMPGDLTDKKLWDLKVVAVGLHGKDVIEVIRIKNAIFEYDKENNVTRNILDIQTTESSHITFYYQITYKGKKKIEIPWDFKVGSLRQFTNRSNITYKTSVTEVK